MRGRNFTTYDSLFATRFLVDLLFLAASMKVREQERAHAFPLPWHQVISNAFTHN